MKTLTDEVTLSYTKGHLAESSIVNIDKENVLTNDMVFISLIKEKSNRDRCISSIIFCSK